MNFPDGARNHGDGRVSFPHRGHPPPDPPEGSGWYADPDDPYMWIQEYVPCKHRTPLKMIRCLSSGKVRPHDYCELLAVKVNPCMCAPCPKAEKPTE